jgi:hypothetical protein
MRKITKRFLRETNDVEPSYFDPLVIELDANGRIFRIKRKGLRKYFTLTYAEIFAYVYRREVKAIMAEKAAKKKARKAKHHERRTT